MTVAVCPLVALVLLACGGAQHPEAARCPIDRKLVLAGPDDVRRAAACQTASSVTVRTGAMLELAQLRDLASIDGDLVIGPTVGIDEIQLAGLTSVGGTIHVGSNGSLRGLYLPRLERAGRIEIDGNVVLATLSMPRLAAVAGAMIATDERRSSSSTRPHSSRSAASSRRRGAELALLEPRQARKDAGIRVERAPLLPPEVVEQLGKPPASP